MFSTHDHDTDVQHDFFECPAQEQGTKALLCPPDPDTHTMQPNHQQNQKSRQRPWGGTRGFLTPAAFGLLAIFLVAGIFAPWLAPYGIDDMDLAARLVPPLTDWAHPMGTDELGRDVLTRLLFSIRLSFLLAVTGTLLGAVIGTTLGFLAARFGGLTDDAVNMGVDFTASLPFIILALTIIAFLGTDITVIIVIMAVYGWDRYARLTRNLARSAYTEGYAGALESLGIPTARIALHHILPNIASALVVNMTLNFPGMILLETSLSFLGVGVQPPMSSLGTMLGFGRDYLTTAWWIAVVPGVVIVLSTLSMSIVGDWVQQKLEPVSR